jgi:hypothetical protein
MVDDIKLLTKKCTDLEKRLRFAEAKLKVVADAMTSPKDIENYLDVLHKKMGREMAVNESVSRKLVLYLSQVPMRKGSH